MCVGKCSRCAGLCLVVLSILSITMNMFLLFPNLDGSYLTRNLISNHARRMPGVWAGGCMVLLAGLQTTLAGFKVRIITCCGPRCDMLLSIIFSSVALVGAAMCLIITTAGLTNGPYCLYSVREMEGEPDEKWGYPFKNNEPQLLNNSANIYLSNIILWSTVCIEPPRIAIWNAGFSISLGLINLLQIFLCLFQFINATFGVVGGHCDPKKHGSSKV
ncbi:transmembrane 4 L6 family member 5-like [Discoglossus pictus]